VVQFESQTWISSIQGVYSMKPCPFRIGDRIKFTPDQRTVGWSWPAFDRLKLKPGDIGIVTRIDKNQYVFLDDERGGFHWECFSPT